MPWKEINLMYERIKFVARLLDGEKMTVVCREFGISRKTGTNSGPAMSDRSNPAPPSIRQQYPVKDRTIDFTYQERATHR